MDSRATVVVAALASSATFFGCAAPIEGEDGVVDNASAALSVAPGCPGTDWVIPETWSGIAGSYFRTSIAPKDELSFLGVLAEPAQPGSPGRPASKVPYVRIVGGLADSGQLLPVPTNPLLGPALVFFDATGATIRDVYSTPAVARDPLTKRVTRICAVYASDGDRKPFVLTRLGI